MDALTYYYQLDKYGKVKIATTNTHKANSFFRPTFDEAKIVALNHFEGEIRGYQRLIDDLKNEIISLEQDIEKSKKIIDQIKALKP